LTLQELEVRLRTLEDIEEINKLQRAYGYYLEHWQTDEIIGLFSQSPDASVEVSNQGQYKGMEGIRKFFSYPDHFVTRSAKPPPEFLHLMLPVSGIVDVDPGGKTAKGRWYGFSCCAIPTDGKVQALLGSGIWENEYVKEDGKWKFKKLFWNRIFSTPYEDGWVKTPDWKRLIPRDRPAPGPNTRFATYPSGYIFPYHYKNPVTGK